MRGAREGGAEAGDDDGVAFEQHHTQPPEEQRATCTRQRGSRM